MTPRRKLKDLTCPRFLAYGIYRTDKTSPWSQEISPFLGPTRTLALPNRTLYYPIQQFWSESV